MGSRRASGAARRLLDGGSRKVCPKPSALVPDLKTILFAQQRQQSLVNAYGGHPHEDVLALFLGDGAGSVLQRCGQAEHRAALLGREAAEIPDPDSLAGHRHEPPVVIREIGEHHLAFMVRQPEDAPILVIRVTLPIS